ADEREREVHDHRAVQRRAVLLADAFVDAVSNERGPGEQGGGLEQQHQHRARDRELLRAQHAKEAAQDLARLVARQRFLGDGVAPKAAHYGTTSLSTASSSCARCSSSTAARASTSRYSALNSSKPSCVPSAITLPPSSSTTR